MIGSIVVIISSLILIFQGLCWTEVLSFSGLYIEKFLSITFLAITRLVILKYALILGLVGVCLGCSLLFLYRQEDFKDTGRSKYMLVFIYPLLTVLTII